MRHLLLILPAAAMLLAAPPQTPQALRLEVRGLVVETGTNQPLAGAEISVSTPDPGPRRWKLEQSIKTTTDAKGAFSISLTQTGSYRIQAQTTGFGPPAGPPPRPGSADYFSSPRDSAEFSLTDTQPIADVKLSLSRYGALSGNIVDQDTGQPIPNLKVNAVSPASFPGRFVPRTSTNTGADGRFLFASLPPGEYAVEIAPQPSRATRVLTTFTDKDVQVTDPDYDHTYWPNGPGLFDAVPVKVASGATVPVGTLRVRKVPYYRVHVRIPESNCEPGETMRIIETTTSPEGVYTSGPPLGQTECGAGFLITGYSRGNYRLLLDINGRSRENAGTASVPFSIDNKNLEITAPIRPGVTVDGVIVVAESSKPPDFSKLSVVLLPADGQSNPNDQHPPDGSGKFQIPYVRPVSSTVMLHGLGATHYVKEIRYNGSPLSGESVPLDQPVGVRSLTIVVDDKVAAITGSVVRLNSPVRNPIIFAVKWPLGSKPIQVKVQGDATGRFQINGLTPGEYHIVALETMPQALFQKPFERMMTAGKMVVVGPGATQNVILEPFDPALLQ